MDNRQVSSEDSAINNGGSPMTAYAQADLCRLALESLLKRTKDADTRVTVEAVLASLDVVISEMKGPGK